MASKPTKRRRKLTFDSGRSSLASARLRELIIYISSKCQFADRYGVTKLNKILAFGDFTSFARYGQPITGVQYMRQPNGPVPRKMKPLITQMERVRDIAIPKIQVGRFSEHRVIPLRQPDLSIFTARDIAMIDEVIEITWDATGQQVSDFSHGTAWQVAGQSGAAIPYEAGFLSDAPLTAAEIARSRELARKFNWETV